VCEYVLAGSSSPVRGQGKPEAVAADSADKDGGRFGVVFSVVGGGEKQGEMRRIGGGMGGLHAGSGNFSFITGIVERWAHRSSMVPLHTLVAFESLLSC
jgi:hypothetical protein